MDKLSDAKSLSGCRSLPCTMAHPWLVFSYGKNKKSQIFVDPLNPSNKTYRKRIPEMRYHSYRQPSSHERWFIMSAYKKNDLRSKYSDCFLWNPETSEKIQLPSHFHWMNKYSLSDYVLHSPPSNDNICDSIVYFLFSYESVMVPSYFLLYCHPGDKQWRQQDFPSSFKIWLSGFFCSQGKLYIISSNDDLLEVEEETQRKSNYYKEDGIDSGKSILKITPFYMKNIKSSVGIISSPFKGSLTNIVESRGEVFKVTRHYYNPYTHVEEIFDLEIFMMDFSLMAWKEVKSMGDHVLFLDIEGNTSVSCSATELGLTKGCVFFLLANDKTLYKFDIEDGSIGFSLPYPNLPTPWLSPSWMTIRRRRTERRTTTSEVICNDVEEGISIQYTEERKASINKDDCKEIIAKNSRRELEQESSQTSWGSLSQDILELISGYLHLLDCLHFRAACKENRFAATTKMKHMKYASLSPWLIFSKTKDGIYNLAEPIYNDKFFINLSNMLVDATICYSKGGWLLMSKGSRTIFFYNPFTRAIIPLPDLPSDFPIYNYSGMCFSSLPTSLDCAVFGIAADWDHKKQRVLYIERGDDSWSSDEAENSTFVLPSEEKKCVNFVPLRNNPVFYKEAFYCLDFNGKLGVMDTRDYLWEILDLRGPCDSTKQSFLLECDGKLLAVFLSQFRTYVKVFRLDMDKKLWVKVETLGKYMLFISNTSSLSAIAPNTRMENRIYFPRFHGEDIVYYSLDTCKYHTSGSQQYSGLDFYDTKEQLYCSWVEPNWSLSTAQELDWCSISEEVDE